MLVRSSLLHASFDEQIEQPPVAWRKVKLPLSECAEDLGMDVGGLRPSMKRCIEDTQVSGER